LDEITSWPLLIFAGVAFAAVVGTAACLCERVPLRELFRREVSGLT
jgi:hypothetical protein